MNAVEPSACGGFDFQLRFYGPLNTREVIERRSSQPVSWLVLGTLRPTPLPWLPVLANIEPPALRRKAAIDRLVAKASAHESWPLHHDISNPPQLRLPSRKPFWHELKPIDINSQWRESWKSALVVNAHLVDDPHNPTAGFLLSLDNSGLS